MFTENGKLQSDGKYPQKSGILKKDKNQPDKKVLLSKSYIQI